MGLCFEEVLVCNFVEKFRTRFARPLFCESTSCDSDYFDLVGLGAPNLTNPRGAPEFLRTPLDPVDRLLTKNGAARTQKGTSKIVSFPRVDLC